jgi:hypothetical protein
LAVDAAGNLYVADAALLEVVLVPATGGTATVIDANLQTPNSVAVDGVGNVYLADGSLHGIVELERTMGTLSFVNGATSLNATLSSIGNLPILPSGGGFTQTDATDFAISPGAPGACNFANAIAAGSTCFLAAAFTPHTAAILSDVVTMKGNYANLGLATPQSLELTLTGQQAATGGPQVAAITNAGAYVIAGLRGLW